MAAPARGQERQLATQERRDTRGQAGGEDLDIRRRANSCSALRPKCPAPNIQILSTGLPSRVASFLCCQVPLLPAGRSGLRKVICLWLHPVSYTHLRAHETVLD